MIQNELPIRSENLLNLESGVIKTLFFGNTNSLDSAV